MVLCLFSPPISRKIENPVSTFKSNNLMMCPNLTVCKHGKKTYTILSNLPDNRKEQQTSEINTS